MNKQPSAISHQPSAVLFGMLLLLAGLPSSVSGQILSLPANPTFQNVFIQSGGKIDFGAGDVTLTHSADALTLLEGSLILPDGSLITPSLQFVGDSNTGLYHIPDYLLFVAGGGLTVTIGSPGLNIQNGYLILSSSEVYLDSESPGVFQQGIDVAAPVAQTFKGPDGLGADKPGGDMTYAPGRPTGTGLPGKIFLATSTTGGGSSSTQQVLVNRMTISEIGIAPSTNGLLPLGSPAVGWKGLYLDYTNTATVGNVTINKASGRAIIAAAASSVVVTNNLATAASRCLAVLAVNDATALSIRSCITAASSLTITTNGVAAANAAVDWVLVNAD